MNRNLEDTLTPLARRLADVQAQIVDLQGVETAVKASIKALVPDPDTYAAGPLTVVVSTSGRLDTKALEAKWSPTERPELYEQHITTAAAREHMAPVDLEPFTKWTAPSVTIR